jgi:polyisoprenoid-binding protein YceI
MKKILTLSLCLLFSGAAGIAQTQQLNFVKEKSLITYKLTHPLHEVEATSKDAVFQVEADVKTKEIKSVIAAVDVSTFDSGNSNRDSHAMEVIDALDYPDVNFTSTSIVQSGDSLTVTGRLTFHGVTHDIVAHAISVWSPTSLEVQGKFDLSLTAFKIERPTLLMIPVDDTLRFTFTTVFKTE